MGFVDPNGLAKGGKQNISTEGFNKNSDPNEVKKVLEEAKKAGQFKRYLKLKALLKVIKRGGTLMICPGIEEAWENVIDPCSDPNNPYCA